MSKHKLMLSAAAMALLSGPAFADDPSFTCPTSGTTCITKKTTTALTTGALSSTDAAGKADAGNIYIYYDDTNGDGSIVLGKKSTAIITVDTSSYVYSDGYLTNNGYSNVTGIMVDTSTKPDLSSATFTDFNDETINGAGIYLDQDSYISLTGDGTGKRGIYLYDNTCSSTVACSYTGDITMAESSSMSIKGNSSYGIDIAEYSVLKGDLTIGGTISLAQTKTKSTSSSGLYGIYSAGEIDGYLEITENGAISVIGAGAKGIEIVGSGMTGSITITGSVATSGYSSSTYSSSDSDPTYPEAGSALEIGSSIDKGIEISGLGYSGDSSSSTGSVTMSGSSSGSAAAVYISPNLTGDTVTESLTIGVYQYYDTDTSSYKYDAYDPGFSFYNRGTISATPANYNNSSLAMKIVGVESYPTLLTGGIYNSGSISASATTKGDTASANSATALYIGDYVYVSYTTSATDSYSTAGKSSGDLAALVNTNATGGGGKISASVSGTRGGTALALYISKYAKLPSIINSGTISASATTTETDITNTLYAYAIQDKSGTLTSITNTGTIVAYTTLLDDDLQSAVAIDLSSGNLNGVEIDSYATATKSAVIEAIYSDGSSGTAILFGDGDNQIIKLTGVSTTYTSSIIGDIYYGTGTGDSLSIGEFSYVKGSITADTGVAVDVAGYGELYLENDTTSLNVTTLNVAKYGTIYISVSEKMTNNTTGSIKASGEVHIEKDANLGVTYASFVPQGNNSFILITAPTGTLTVDDLTTYNDNLSKSNASCVGSADTSDCGGTRPFLFASESLVLDNTSSTTVDKLVLEIKPKTSTELGLTGYAAQMFSYANTALAKDDKLGAAMINYISDKQEAQKAYNSFAPNVTGGTRAIAISITDQATGAVAARQRALRMYSKTEGELTLWGQEFVQMIKSPSQDAVASDGTKTKNGMSGFKDHGFGVALGIDAGSPRDGWYGGALTFYNGDVNEIGRDSHQNEIWLVLSGYSTWRGKGMFLDAKIDAGYGHIKGKRYINLVSGSSTYTREADNSHAGALLSGGFTTGGIFSYGAITLMPQLSVDGLVMREDGYLEDDPDDTVTQDGFDLKVEPYYARSLRVFLGTSVRYDLKLWDFYLQPEARIGYRYDVMHDPVKLKAAFKDIDPDTTGNQYGTQFKMVGPDPAQGNFVVGGSLATTTDSWTLGFNFDLVRGDNGTMEEVGTLSILGRI